MKQALLFSILIAGSACGQTVLLSGFETAGVFDLGGVSTYCSLAAVQGSNDTPGGGSIWSAEIPATFSSTCAAPAITQGLFFALPGLSAEEHVGISFQHKVPTVNALSMNVLYVNPAGSPLPASEWDLGFPEIGFYEPGTGAWSDFTGSFDVPTLIPWPSDMYLVIRYMADQVNAGSALIDNVVMTTDVNTGLNAREAPSSVITITPVPALDHITVNGLVAGEEFEVFNSAGTRMFAGSMPQNSTFSVDGLAPGLYVVRQGDRCARFIKE
jgi:hypothetical protein